VILYFLIFNQFPFRAKSYMKLFDKIQRKEPKYDDQLPQVVGLIKGMLAKDAAKRFTLKQVLNHPWISSKGSCPLSIEGEELSSRETSGLRWATKSVNVKLNMNGES
jgi:serine/threonine protein kinase